MLCSKDSLYPDIVDKSLFFQDANIDTVKILEQFQKYISLGQYTKAKDYINSQEGLSGVFACYLNAYENRIYNLQKHLQGKTKTNPHFFQELIPPENISNDEFWLGGGYPTDKYVLDFEEATLDGTTVVINDSNCSVDVDNKILTLRCDNNIYEAIEEFT